MTITKENVNQEISKKVAAAYALIKECEDMADEFETEFSFDLCCGAGCSYQGKKDCKWESHGWNASSQSC